MESTTNPPEADGAPEAGGIPPKPPRTDDPGIPVSGLPIDESRLGGQPSVPPQPVAATPAPQASSSQQLPDGGLPISGLAGEGSGLAGDGAADAAASSDSGGAAPGGDWADAGGGEQAAPAGGEFGGSTYGGETSDESPVYGGQNYDDGMSGSFGGTMDGYVPPPPPPPAPVVPLKPLKEAFQDALSKGMSTSVLYEASGAAYETDSRVVELEATLNDWTGFSGPDPKDAEVLRGFIYYQRGDFAAADNVFGPIASESAWAALYSIRTKLARGRVADAQKQIAGLSAADDIPIIYGKVETLCRDEKVEEALQLVETVADSQSETADWLLAKAFCLEADGEWRDAIEFYRQAAERSPRDANAHFRLGFLLDLYGADDDAADEAVQAYEVCMTLKPLHTNAVVNLGLIYEDRERYHDAAKCYETVLRIHPNHARAKLYFGDALAATNMFYDRDQEKKADRHSQILKIPVTDFELSVRSRNCLQKMDIATLGDLIMKTEQELLSYKNFGETSLKEIKEMLTQKNLRLGQGLEDRGREPPSGRNPLEATASAEVLDKAIEELNLSVRSRRCMERLDVRSVRDLINKTEVELMSAKNFGMTSLNEIKRKLGELGMILR